MATAPLLTPVLASLATLAIAVALDLALAEPPARVHPVALFGSVVGRFDRSWSRPRLVGVAVAVGLPIGVAAFAGGIVAAASFALPAFSALPVSSPERSSSRPSASECCWRRPPRSSN